MNTYKKSLSCIALPIIGFLLLPVAHAVKVEPGLTPRNIPPKYPIPAELHIPVETGPLPSIPRHAWIISTQSFGDVPSGQTPRMIPPRIPLPPELAYVDEAREEVEYGARDRNIDPQDYIQNASDLIEDEIQNEDGERLGTFNDIVIDARTGQIVFVAVRNPEEGIRLIPPQTLQPVPGENHLALNVEPAQWRQANVIQHEEVDLLAIHQKADQIYDDYGVNYRTGMPDSGEPREFAGRGKPDQKEPAHADVVRLPGDPVLPRAAPPILPPDRAEVQRDLRADREFGSPRERSAEGQTQGLREREAPEKGDILWGSDLLRKTVTNTDEEPVGEIADLILDLHVGDVQHVIVSYDEAEPKHFAIPMNDIDVGDEGRIIVRTDLSALEDAPEFEPRVARLRRYEPFRYDAAEAPEFGAPARETEKE